MSGKTAAQAAKEIGVHPSTLRRWLVGSSTVAKTRGGHYRLTEEEIKVIAAMRDEGQEEESLRDCLRWVAIKAGSVARATVQSVAGTAANGGDWRAVAEQHRGGK